MKLYSNTGGRYLYAVYERDLFAFKHSTNSALTIDDIAEIDANKDLCAELAKHINGKWVNASGLGKYYRNAGVLTERENWVRAPPQIFGG